MQRVPKYGTTELTYLTSRTSSADFPTTSLFQSLFGGGSSDAYVVKLSADCCTGTRGNANGDVNEAVTVADITFLVQYLFQGGAIPPCTNVANVNGNGSITIADVTYLVKYLFIGGQPPLICP